ncbi:MAG: phenylalanine--tRNA ligase subunit beta [Methanomassiliicoccus sp.]|nr:phenylalanine--tRNA ligase subunit beta [Methanomassiliicoccus sp.]
MPVVTFSYDDLISLIGKEVSLETLMDRVPQLGADVHSYDEGTREMSIEFFPDRPDLYSVEGAARALRTFLGHESGLTRYNVEDSDVVLNLDESIKEVRPYMVAGVVEDITITDSFIRSLMEMQEKLHLTMGRKRSKVSIGIHDMDKVTPPFTYKAVEPGSVSFVPLGKTESMDLGEILQRHEKGVDYARILDGKERYPLLVDSEGEVLSFPPIINGVLTTVTEDTKNVFLDVTGTDLNAISGALNIVATAMAERGGKIKRVRLQGTQQGMTPDLEPREWTLDVAATNALLGMDLDAEGMAKASAKMGFDSEPAGNQVRVLAPAWRLDLIHPVDIMEDVAKGYGYENFGKSLPTHQTFGSELLVNKAADVARQLMVGYGYLEATTLTLSSVKDQFEKMRLSPGDVVEVLNPISEDHTCLRVSLLPSLMLVLRRNKHRDLPQRLFEVGDVMMGIKRRRHLAGVSISARASFTEVKSLVESVMRDLSVKYVIQPSSVGTYLEGRGADVIVDGACIGNFGEMHPQVIVDFELGYPIAAFELDLEAMTEGKLERVA